MKYLQDYQEEKQTELFNQFGVFFAFSKVQLNEGIDKNKSNKKVLPGEKHTHFPGGMFAPSKNADIIIEKLDSIYKEAIAQDLKENGKKGIIKRELHNHEAFYTYSIEDTVDKVKPYGFTTEDINKVFQAECKVIDWDTY